MIYFQPTHASFVLAYLSASAWASPPKAASSSTTQPSTAGRDRLESRFSRAVEQMRSPMLQAARALRGCLQSAGGASPWWSPALLQLARGFAEAAAAVSPEETKSLANIRNIGANAASAPCGIRVDQRGEVPPDRPAINSVP